MATGRSGGITSTVKEWAYAFKRWMYRGGRPGPMARVLNRWAAIQFWSGVLSPGPDVALEVRGRTSGRAIMVPVVVADHEGGRHLVSMLGENANWIRNVRAADGAAVLIDGSRERIHLVEVDATRRAPVLRRYLEVAPQARPHVTVDHDAPLEEFERVAAHYPVFRIEPVTGRG